MIKPTSLWNFIHECEAEDAEYIGRICLALAGKSVEFTRAEKIQFLSIAKDNKDMDERIHEQRERWRIQKQEQRGQKKSASVHEDKKCPQVSARTKDCPRASDTIRSSAPPSNHPKIEREIYARTRDDENQETINPKLADVVNAAKTVMGVPEYYARWWYAEMTARGWLNTDGTSVGTRNWRPTLKAWHNREDAKHLAEIKEELAAAEKREVKVSAKDWTLCEERCANCANGKCAKGIRIPPELERRPPEECKGFKPR